MENLLGNYDSMVRALAAGCVYPLSFLRAEGGDVAAWQARARGELCALLGYEPPAVALRARVLERWTLEGVDGERVAWEQPYGPATEAFFLKPANARGRLPAVVAFHCHGGYKYYGKEKVCAYPGEDAEARGVKEAFYGGAAWANELARRGFAVLAADVFLWGSRKMRFEGAPPEFAGSLRELREGSAEYIEAYNEVAWRYEDFVAKALFMSGATWPGVMADENRRALDYLCGREDVDAARIGCGGLSGGGEQVLYTVALDERIRCAVCTGFMSTFAETVRANIQSHTWMAHVPGLARRLDWPDIPTLGGGTPLMVQNCDNDALFSPKGQRDAGQKLEAIYEKLGQPEKLAIRTHPGGHRFDVAMQEEAFAWFEKWLG